MSQNALMTLQKEFQKLRGTTFQDLHGDKAALHFAQEWSYLQQLMRDPKKAAALAGCDPDTVIDCIKTVAVMGLTLSPIAKKAYLIPYGKICTLRISYRGEIDYLASQGVIDRAVMGAVYSNDKFKIEQGHDGTKYYYAKAHGDRGQFVGAFCVFHLPGGGTHGDFLPFLDIKKRKAKSKSDEFWRDWFEEMAMKTAVHYALRGLPSSPAIQKLQEVEQPHILVDAVQSVEIDDERAKQINAMFANVETVRDLDELFGNFDDAERMAKRAQDAYMFHKGRIVAERKALKQ